MDIQNGAPLVKEDVEGGIKSAVGVVFHKDTILLGKAITNDFRNKKWCFPGGGVEDKDSDAIEAAIREVYEEANIEAVPRWNCTYKEGPILFVGMDYLKGTIKHNGEFSEMKWFPLDNLPKDILFKNKNILKKICLQ